MTLMEIVKEEWGLKLREPSFYKSMNPKTHSKEEWYKYVDKNIEEVNYREKNNLPYSERLVVVKLYKYCNE